MTESAAPQRPATGAKGSRQLAPTDFAYAEVGKLDPEAKGNAFYDIVPGRVTELSARVRRLTAPNPSYMTGPGTNTYLVGARGEDIAVIDPGPPEPAHIQAIVDAAAACAANGRGGRIRWILATHTHRDHSPGAALLKASTGAEVVGMPPPAGSGQDDTFHPDRVVKDGDRVAVGGCTLRVIHTPGHASNQNCYLLEEEKLLFTGDHIMQGSTVVINPPDGDMAVYMQALAKLLPEDLEWLAPGHGFLIGQPRRAVEYLIKHRLGREGKVLDKLRGLGAGNLEELVPLAYDDVPAQIHPWATRSLLAHLIKLKAEGKVSESNGRWSAR
jgi:glyoxylase-like metal-dependent hydrolase (beta-lactamase superfamily II)